MKNDRPRGAPAHVSTGIRGVLERSFVYNLWQALVGSEAAKKKIVRDFVCPFPGARILDIGCGTGTLLDHLEKDCRVDYVGCDINPAYIEHAKKLYGSRGRFYCTSVADASFPEKDFDVAVAIGILHHLNDNESRKLVELAASGLKKGGRLVLVEPVFTDRQSFLERYLMKRDRGRNIRLAEEYVHFLKTVFSEISFEINPHLYRIPWTLFLAKATK